MNTTLSVEEGNFLIASFMGYDYPNIDNGAWKVSKELHCYNQDWRLLMPVVEKIEALNDRKLIDKELPETFDDKPYNFAVFIFKSCCDVQIDNSVGDHIIEITAAKNKITAVYQAVVQFIQWYNKQNQILIIKFFK